MPSSVLSWSSPYKVLMKSEPDYSRLKVIGCLCYAAISDNFAPRALRCVFLGYPCAQKAYKLYDLDNHIIIISRDVLFKKHIFPYKTFSSTFVDSSHCSVNYFFKNLDTSHCTDHQSDVHNHTTTPVLSTTDQSESSTALVPPRRSTRTSVTPKKFDDFVVSHSYTSKSSKKSQIVNVFTDSQLSGFGIAYLASLHKVLFVYEPSSYSQAKNDPLWIQAMEAELQVLEKNNTWE